MSTFVATYVIVWLAVSLYVIQMGGRQRKLQDRIASLQLRLQDHGYHRD
jgi:CcmD family protein